MQQGDSGRHPIPEASRLPLKRRMPSSAESISAQGKRAQPAVLGYLYPLLFLLLLLPPPREAGYFIILTGERGLDLHNKPRLRGTQRLPATSHGARQRQRGPAGFGSFWVSRKRH